MIGNQMAKSQRHVGNKEVAMEIENDLKDVATHKRRAQSIYQKHLSMVGSLPAREQKKVLELDKEAVMNFVSDDVKLSPLVESGEEDVDEDYDSMELRKKEGEIEMLKGDKIEALQAQQDLEMQIADLKHELQQEHNNTLRTQNETAHVQKELEKYKSDHAALTVERNSLDVKLKASISAVREGEEREHILKGEVEVQKQRGELLEEEIEEQKKWVDQREEEHAEKIRATLKDQEECRKAHHQALEELRDDIDREQKEKRLAEKKINEANLTLSHREQELHSMTQKARWETTSGVATSS